MCSTDRHTAVTVINLSNVDLFSNRYLNLKTIKDELTKWSAIPYYIICGYVLVRGRAVLPQAIEKLVDRHGGPLMIAGGLAMVLLKLNEGYPQYINLAPGLAWSFFDGYMRIVSAGRAPSMFRKLEVIAVPKIILLFPFHSVMQHFLDRVPGISVVGKINVAQANRGGQAQRKYDVSIYEICYNGEYYYVPLEGALGVDHINKIFENSGIPEDRQKMYKEEQYAAYVNHLQEHANKDETMSVRGGDGDIFVFLLYDDGPGDVARQIVAGLRQYGRDQGVTINKYTARMNVAARLQSHNHPPLLSDKTVESILGVNKATKKYKVKLRGPFAPNEPDQIEVTLEQMKLAKDALQEFNDKNEDRGDSPMAESTFNPDDPSPEDLVHLGSDTSLSFSSLPNEVQREVIGHICAHIGTRWKDLYRKLCTTPDFQEQASHIASIEHTHANASLVEHAHTALDKWLQVEGTDATVRKLMVGLSGCRRRDLAEYVKQQSWRSQNGR